MIYWLKEIFDLLKVNTSKPIRRDNSDPNNIYAGYAPDGTQNSDTVWRIEKRTTYPNETRVATGAWDDRYNLTYL